MDLSSYLKTFMNMNSELKVLRHELEKCNYSFILICYYENANPLVNMSCN